MSCAQLLSAFQKWSCGSVHYSWSGPRVAFLASRLPRFHVGGLPNWNMLGKQYASKNKGKGTCSLIRWVFPCVSYPVTLTLLFLWINISGVICTQCWHVYLLITDLYTLSIIIECQNKKQPEASMQCFSTKKIQENWWQVLKLDMQCWKEGGGKTLTAEKPISGYLWGGVCFFPSTMKSFEHHRIVVCKDWLHKMCPVVNWAVSVGCCQKTRKKNIMCPAHIPTGGQ